MILLFYAQYFFSAILNPKALFRKNKQKNFDLLLATN